MNILFLKPTNQFVSPLGKQPDFQRNYDYNQWDVGFKELDHNTTTYDLTSNFANFGSWKVGRNVSRLINEKRIDLIIIPAMYFEISRHHLKKWKKTNVKILFVFFDDTFRFENYNRYYIEDINYILTQETSEALSKYFELGYLANFFPCFPSSKWTENNINQERFDSPETDDVIFIGANIANRSEYIDFLAENAINVQTYGRGWPGDWLESSEMCRKYKQAKISLNFTENIDELSPKVLKARPFEISLAGGCLLLEENEELKKYFEPGIDALYFKNKSECLDQIRILKSDSDLRNGLVRNSTIKSQELYNFELAWEDYLRKLLMFDNLKKEVTNKPKIPKHAIQNAMYWKCKFLILRHGKVEISSLIREYIDFVVEILFLTKRYNSVFPALLAMKSYANLFRNKNKLLTAKE